MKRIVGIKVIIPPNGDENNKIRGSIAFRIDVIIYKIKAILGFG